MTDAMNDAMNDTATDSGSEPSAIRRLDGFARISAAVPPCRPADARRNSAETLTLWREADAAGAAVVAFPELGLSGYTARDLLLDQHLLAACAEELLNLAESGRELGPLALVGLPVRVGAGVYNCAAAIQAGEVLALIPKAYLPTYREFEEARWFRPGREVPANATARIGDRVVPFGTDILLAAEGCPDLVVGVEVCEDTWVHAPPAIAQVSAGATVTINLSASNFVLGKAELRRLLARASSDRGKCAAVYVAAGPGESSTDLAFDADAFIVENGSVVAESERFRRTGQLVTTDIDLDRLVHERIVTGSFGDCARETLKPFRRIPFRAAAGSPLPLLRHITPHPFLPSDPATLATRCWEIFEIQVNALATRLRATGLETLVLGISGGLDSTHAALVSAAALDLLGLPRSALRTVTMPGLGTSSQTRSSAGDLAAALGADFREIGVSEASRVLLEATGHPAAAGVDGPDTVEALIERLRTSPELGDVTVENIQARLRTLILMTLANAERGIVVGTGDLSEKALGWSTYSGDHIAMYDVNAGVPKTLIRFVIRWVANERATHWNAGDPAALRDVLFRVLDTPISPELLPTDEDGAIAQLTESTLGPYELHDFFLYHLVRHGARPRRILQLARLAFAEREFEELRSRLTLFLTRFFRFQFKRSCTADAPKVGMVALSPRGDWRMPSDAVVDSWLKEVEATPDPLR